jgi:hypothetical protein
MLQVRFWRLVGIRSLAFEHRARGWSTDRRYKPMRGVDLPFVFRQKPVRSRTAKLISAIATNHEANALNAIETQLKGMFFNVIDTSPADADRTTFDMNRMPAYAAGGTVPKS